MLQYNSKLKLLVLCVVVLLSPSPARAFARGQAADDDFFEKKVRPLLVERCGKCHGDAKPKGGLRLTSRLDVVKGGDSGPAAVAGKPEESLLLRAVRHEAENLKMPPKGKLTDQEIQVLANWVRRGMHWPEEKSRPSSVGQAHPRPEQQLWSLQPVRKVAPPPVKNTAWLRSPIDSFIRVKLDEQGLVPARPADKQTLLRRVTFDLIGLPPTPEEIHAFLEDRSADAFAKVVDRLLASPHYGERWGRHWLDLVHYADGQPSESNFPEIWLYRDWVAKAFNRDLPYKDFLALQIAGDLLQSPGDLAGVDANEMDAIVATGVFGMTYFDVYNLDAKLMNAEYVDDQVDVVGRAFLGLTLSCARCHDHKFDPISTKDYYALAGIFFNTRPIVELREACVRVRTPLVPKEEKLRLKRESELQSALAGWPTLSAGLVVSLLGTSQAPGPLLTIPALNPVITTSVIAFGREGRAALQKELKELQKRPHPPSLQAISVSDGGLAKGGFENFRDARIYIRGDPHNPGEVVPRGVPRALGGEKLEPITQGSGRLQLARWLTRPDNPLTARVMVNRLWQHHFGEGIVRTPNNFGELGERPTHPELLDYLAARFIQSGWSLKTMHRLLLLSATYQQSGIASPEVSRLDPENHLWGRMNRRRLESEAIRDSLLTVTGRLNLSLGGPGFHDLTDPRRTFYLMTDRYEGTSYFGSIFDQPSPNLICEKRNTSTVAPQALFMLNDPFVARQAKALADRLMRETGEKSAKAKIQKLYSLCLGRLPTPAEIDIGLQFLAQRGTPSDSSLPVLAASSVGLMGRPGKEGPLLAASALARRALASWQRYCQAIFSVNEFIYVD
jgi:cytochrome c553